MSASLADKGGHMNVAAYLQCSLSQPEGRYELVEGVPVAMSPERHLHSSVKRAVYRAIVEAVRSARADCIVFTDGPTIVIDDHRPRKPDVSVQRELVFDPDAMTMDAPVIVIEVTSPTSMRTDTDDKLIEYFSLPSICHDLLVHPGHRTVVHHHRNRDGSAATAIGGAGSLDFAPLDFDVDAGRVN